MSKLSLKKDFEDGTKLPSKDLNNNFLVIEECVNNTEKAPSAYELAEDFEGTEEEWLASLVGPQGPDGVEGKKGKPGASGGYAFFYLDGISNAQGYDNIFSNYTPVLSNIETQILQNNDLNYLNINVSSISKLDLVLRTGCSTNNVDSTTANIVEYVVDVYNEDMSTLLKTYTFKHEVTKVIEYPLFEGENRKLMDFFNIKFSIDTSSFDNINLSIKANVLKYENGVASEGTMQLLTTADFLIEAFA